MKYMWMNAAGNRHITTTIEQGPGFDIIQQTITIKKILFVLLAGDAVGLLVTPDKRSETFKKIVDAFDDIKDKAIKDMNRIIDKTKKRMV